jgi:adenosylhomocysteine nucleosidase
MIAMKCIVVAMEKEAAYLLSKSEVKKTKQAGFAKIMECEIGKTPYLLVVCGIGKAFAASAVTSVLNLYPSVDVLLNIGVAGSLDSHAVPLFSSVIATSLVEHDLDTSPIGDPVGLVSGINLVQLPVDEKAKSTLVTAAKKLGITPLLGVISSGDTFYADHPNKKRIHDTFGSLCSDMESAPMAQIAYAYHKPFACLRLISDADNASEEYAKNAVKAAIIAGQIAEVYLAM